MEKTKVVLKTITKPKLASLPAWLIICLISLTVACRKEAAIEATPPSTVAQAKTAFGKANVENSVSFSGKSLLADALLKDRMPLWDEAFVEQHGENTIVFVPIGLPSRLHAPNGTYLNDKIYLRLIDKGNGFHKNNMMMITLLPETEWKKGDYFAGTVFTEQWFYPNVKGYRKNLPSEKTSIEKLSGIVDCYQTLSYTVCVGEESSEVCSDHYATVCIYQDGSYPGEGDDPFPLGEGDNPGGSGYSDPEPPSIPTDSEPPGQDNPSIDPEDYTDCFDNISNTGATFKVTAYVQEPSPGSGQHSGVNGVGHVAIGLTKTGSDGQSITQVLGFYPEGANIFKEFSGPSKVVDNGDPDDPMKYSVKMEFDMGNDATNFEKILNKVNNPPQEYHAFFDNCVRYVYDACKAGGISVPLNISTIYVPTNPALPTSNTVPISAYTPAGMAQAMRQRKVSGDNRVGTANNAHVPTGNGPCN